MRPTIAAALIALVAGLAGCGEAETSAPESEPGRVARICPELGRSGDDAYRERAEHALVGETLAAAQDLAAAGGCRVEAGEIDGVGQVQTREYDPSRITVAVRDDEVVRVLGFG
ncbi:MAG TPA: hypothetical protein VFY99_10235 [Solirubrobacterales bacterium]